MKNQIEAMRVENDKSEFQAENQIKLAELAIKEKEMENKRLELELEAEKAALEYQQKYQPAEGTQELGDVIA